MPRHNGAPAVGAAGKPLSITDTQILAPASAAVNALIDLLVAAVAERLRITSTSSLIDQRQSKLGRRRHAAVVRRRLANGQSGASIVGRVFYLTPEAHQEELDTISRTHVAPVSIEPAKSSIADELLSELQRGGAT